VKSKISTLKDAVDCLICTDERIHRIKELFKYDTLDEADPGKGKANSDVTIELGGPCTHVKFAILTRAEHTILKDALDTLFDSRRAVLVAELGLLGFEE